MTLRLGYWTATWLISTALASFGPKLIWNFDNTFSILAVVLNVIIGFGMIIANKNHLRSLDELQQKIQLEAMALSLGTGLIGGIAYSMLDIANVISFDAEISHLVILVGLTYMGGVIVGQVRYR
jgi:predicted membrane channel-forming protein YqfA (hemolysin III family)